MFVFRVLGSWFLTLPTLYVNMYTRWLLNLNYSSRDLFPYNLFQIHKSTTPKKKGSETSGSTKNHDFCSFITFSMKNDNNNKKMQRENIKYSIIIKIINFRSILPTDVWNWNQLRILLWNCWQTTFFVRVEWRKIHLDFKWINWISVGIFTTVYNGKLMTNYFFNIKGMELTRRKLIEIELKNMR